MHQMPSYTKLEENSMPLHRELRLTKADKRKLEIIADHMGYTPHKMLGIVIDR